MLTDKEACKTGQGEERTGKQQALGVVLFEGVNVTKGLPRAISELRETSATARQVLDAAFRMISSQIARIEDKQTREALFPSDLISVIMMEQGKPQPPPPPTTTAEEQRSLPTHIGMAITVAFQVALFAATHENQQKKKKEIVSGDEREHEKINEASEIKLIGHSSGIASALAVSTSWKSTTDESKTTTFNLETLIKAMEKIVFALFWAGFHVQVAVKEAGHSIYEKWAASVKTTKEEISDQIKEFNSRDQQRHGDDMIEISGMNSKNRVNIVGTSESLERFHKMLPETIKMTMISLTQPVHCSRFQNLFQIVC